MRIKCIQQYMNLGLSERNVLVKYILYNSLFSVILFHPLTILVALTIILNIFHEVSYIFYQFVPPHIHTSQTSSKSNFSMLENYLKLTIKLLNFTMTS